jgi:DNA-binding NtrC family response regulator
MTNTKIGILIVDDEATVRDSLSNWFEKDGYTTGTAADAIEALKKLSMRPWDVILLDIKMPGINGIQLQRKIKDLDPHAVVIIITAYASIETAVEALKHGAFDYLMKPVDPDDLSRLVGKAIEHRTLKKENLQLRDRIREMSAEQVLVGHSPQMKEIIKLVDTVSQTDVTVLVRGERGTGKELIARVIHENSPRRLFPWLPVNCGVLSEEILQRELFGYEKGAFTGAEKRQRGKLEMAGGGTLFLDDIGRIALRTQVDLLRVLDEKQFTRLGGRLAMAADFRVICATHQDLENLIHDGKFREDFYYRINVFEIRIPPLRERRSDIPALARHFLEIHSRRVKKTVDEIRADAMDALMKYAWPGNVRELENVIERAVVVATGQQIETKHLPAQMSRAGAGPKSDSLAAVEREHIIEILGKTGWNITRSARMLGIDRVTLYNKIKKYDLKR